MFVLLLLTKENRLLFFFLKKYDACAVGAPYFSKSFGATFQSYFREDKKLGFSERNWVHNGKQTNYATDKQRKRLRKS